MKEVVQGADKVWPKPVVIHGPVVRTDEPSLMVPLGLEQIARWFADCDHMPGERSSMRSGMSNAAANRATT